MEQLNTTYIPGVLTPSLRLKASLLGETSESSKISNDEFKISGQLRSDSLLLSLLLRQTPQEFETKRMLKQ